MQTIGLTGMYCSIIRKAVSLQLLILCKGKSMHKALLLLCLLWATFLSAQSKCKRLYIKKISVNSKKNATKAWDLRGGKPDLFIRLYTHSARGWKLRFVSKVATDSLTIEDPINSQIDISRHQQIKILVLDKDWGRDDLIGKWLLKPCRRSFEEGKETSAAFAAVTSLVYCFSSHKTLAAQAEAARREYRRKIEGLDKQRTVLEQEYQQKLQLFEKRRQTLQQEYQKKESQLAEEHKKVLQKAQKLQLLHVHLQQERDKIDQQQQRQRKLLVAAEKKYAQEHLQHMELREQLAVINKKYAKECLANMELQEKLAKMHKRTASLPTQEVEKLKAQLAALQETHARQQGQYQALQEQFTSLQKKYDREHILHKALQEQLVNIQEKYNRDQHMQGEYQPIIAEKQRLLDLQQRYIEEQKQLQQQLQEKVHAMGEELQIAKSQLQNSQKQIQLLKQQQLAYRQKIAELKRHNQRAMKPINNVSHQQQSVDKTIGKVRSVLYKQIKTTPYLGKFVTVSQRIMQTIIK